MNAPSPPLRVLFVDDEAPARHRLRDVLADCATELPVAIVGEDEDMGEFMELIRRATGLTD